MNTIIEKIRAEVERRKKEMVDASFPPVIKKTRISELSIVLDILDDIQERTDNPITFTLQEQPVKELLTFDGFVDKVGSWFANLELRRFRKTFDGEIYPATELVQAYEWFVHELSEKYREKHPQEQPVDWQKVAEAHAKDQPLGQDNDGNLVYLQEQPVCEDVEMEIKETELEYQQRSERGEYPASIESICRRFYELGRQSKGAEWTERDIKNGSYISAFLQANCGDSVILKRATMWFMSRLKQLPIQQSKLEVDSEKPVPKEIEEVAKMIYPRKEGDLYSLNSTLQQAAFIAGAKWQKEQMMKDAVEGYVTLTMTGTPTVAATIKEGDNIGVGDKVSIIICKKGGLI